MRFPIYNTDNFSVVPTNDPALYNIFFSTSTSKKTEPVMEHPLSKSDAVNVASALQVAYDKGTSRGKKLVAFKVASALGIAEVLRG